MFRFVLASLTTFCMLLSNPVEVAADSSYEGYSIFDGTKEFVAIYRVNNKTQIAIICTFTESEYEERVRKVESDAFKKHEDCQSSIKQVNLTALVKDINSQEFKDTLQGMDQYLHQIAKTVSSITAVISRLTLSQPEEIKFDWKDRPNEKGKEFSATDKETGVREAIAILNHIFKEMEVNNNVTFTYTASQMDKNYNHSTKYYVYYGLRLLLYKYFELGLTNTYQQASTIDINNKLKINLENQTKRYKEIYNALVTSGPLGMVEIIFEPAGKGPNFPEDGQGDM